MAEELVQTKTIITNREVFPPYLNFDKLRREGIEYLGKLSGKIWTDHNVHDPGITILEILCYAILDLGYRTNLPAIDLFSTDPNSKSQPGFFTPAKILSNNPLAIIDFRKMLIDIPGVVNAWLEVNEEFDVESRATGETVVPCEQKAGKFPVHYLNGLYNVYVELEELSEDEKKAVLDDIKEALMAHRNFCEDFLNIKVLCHEPIGICADIEIKEGADPEKIYLAVIDAVQDFLSPLPKFYSLETLLVERKKSIESIFAGRPYNVKKGHGFIDTEEFEKLQLRKQVHLSDLYNVVNKVDGVVRVNKLKFNKCNASIDARTWHYDIPKDHIPRFDIKCSGFSFSTRDIPLVFDTKKYEELLSFNFRNNGKILYDQTVPYLDTEIPKGVYRSELKEYISIQNEFPKVYGISEGGLPENVALRRKAQALQLKGYLFFFDQLLADYVAQLQNMSSLFSSAPVETTYASGVPSAVSSMQELIRYNSEAPESILGVSGSLLAIPVAKKKIDMLIQDDEIDKLELEKIKPFNFITKTDAEFAISQLKQDIQQDEYSARIISKKDGCVFYYILTSSDEIALIGKKYFSNESQARFVSDALKYAGNFHENYKIYNKPGQQFSFGLEMNLAVYPKYLKSITEDKELFFERRKSFLDHLLLRFAEQFTDFALKGYVTCACSESSVNEIEVKEAVLANFDELSANRGKAYDYLKNRWNNNNVSGFEKRFKALAGIKEWGKHYLSNFEVDEHPIEYIFTLKLGGQEFFSSEQKFASSEEAQEAAQILFKALGDEKAYEAEKIPHKEGNSIRVKYGEGKNISGFLLGGKDYKPEETGTLIENLSRQFSGGDWKEADEESEKVFPSSYNYLAAIKNVAEDRNAFVYVQSYNEKGKSVETAIKNILRTREKKYWQPQEGVKLPAGRLLSGQTGQMPIRFVDEQLYKVDPVNDKKDDPNAHSYILLERKQHSFRFKPLQEFTTDADAKAHANELKVLLIDEANYQVQPAEGRGKAVVQINKNGEPFATSDVYDVKEDRNSEISRIRKIIAANEYVTAVEEQPASWDFSYRLGFEPGNTYTFKTAGHFPDKSTAIKKARAFHRRPDKLNVSGHGDSLALGYKSGSESYTAKFVKENDQAVPEQTVIENLLQIRKDIQHYLETNDPAAFTHFTKPDPVSEQGTWYYRLVNKDELNAFFRDKNLGKEAMLKSATDAFNRGYNYLEIDRKSGNTLKRKDECKKYWYHYRLQSLNAIRRPGHKNEEKEIVLFEGVRGYVSKEEARKKFAEDWLELLHEAADRKNYGEGQLISLREMLIQEEKPGGIDKIRVFIPAETLKWLGETEEQAIEEMIKLVRSFPIRYLQPEKNPDEFEQRFACEEKAGRQKPPPCNTTGAKKIYYFILYNREKDVEDWQSKKYYDSFDKALKAFNHFYFLLRYKGNFYVDCDCNGDYRLFVREVLAVSKRRFSNREDAWGTEGVEKFICIAQSCDSFHHYIAHDCCHSFDIACGKIPVYHPCKYDTPQQRDRAIDLLCRYWKDFISKEPFKLYDDEGGLKIKDLNGNFLAFVYFDMRFATGTFCDLLGLINAINLGEFKESSRELVYNSKKIAEPVNADIPFSQWKYSLTELAWYFPIINEGRNEETRDPGKFCVEIRLPGFNSYRDADHLDENQCPDDLQAAHCFVAWKSACCFDSCQKAFAEWEKLVPVLSDCSNYQPVHDCPCGPFGIDIYNRRLSDIDPYGIIGFNPQCYASMEVACEAAELARSLINSEGLHVVEHILLRPQCPEYYECRLRPSIPCEFTGCEFQWIQDEDDPCKKDQAICFMPGYDPYSFIATVVLPAWPDRFRTPENRLLIQDRLRREAPAHVLLRILWLGPQDFDAFETYFKQWNHWLTGERTASGGQKCTGDFSLCNFLGFLFRSDFDPLDECKVCVCEAGPEEKLPDCFGDEQKNPCDNRDFEEQLEELFRWKKEKFITGEPYTAEEVPDKIRDRQHKYRKVVEKLLGKLTKYPEIQSSLQESMSGLIKKQMVTKDRIVPFIREITKKETMEILEKIFTPSEVRELIQIPLLYYIDTITLDKKTYKGRKKELKLALLSVRNRIPNGNMIYDQWDARESRRINPQIDHREIECWLTGNNIELT